MERKWFIKDRIKNTDFIEICKNSRSMAEAAFQLKIHFSTLKKRALELGCYNPNQSGKGEKKNKSKGLIPLDEILKGKHPQYQTFKLKNRLLKTGIKKNKCEICSISEWQNQKINLELDHIDGNRNNHMIENLRIICPNCHSQTLTYRAKKRRT